MIQVKEAFAKYAGKKRSTLLKCRELEARRFVRFFLPSWSVESNDGGQTRLLAQLRLRIAKPRERQGSTPSSYEATEGAAAVRQPQPLTAAITMATRREPTAADADGSITDETFLQNEICFDAGFTSKLSFKKAECGGLTSFVIYRLILFVHKAVKYIRLIAYIPR